MLTTAEREEGERADEQRRTAKSCLKTCEAALGIGCRAVRGHRPDALGRSMSVAALSEMPPTTNQ